MSKICFVQHVIPEYRLAYFEALSIVSDHDVELVAASVAPSSEDHFRVRSATAFGSSDSLLLLWGAAAASRKADCVVTPLSGRNLTSHLLARRRSKQKLILWGHGMARGQLDLGSTSKMRDGFDASARLRRNLMSRADGIATYTPDGADAIRRLHPGIDCLVSPVGNALYPRHLLRAADVRRTNILVSGRLIADKRVDAAIDAFALASKELGTDAKLTIVGDGPARAELESRAERLGIDSRVDFVGAVWDPLALRSLYDQCFCHLSAGYVGLSGIQAAGWGVRTVTASNQPHAPEVHLVERAGALVLTESLAPSELAAGIILAREAEDADPGSRHEIAAKTANTSSTEVVADNWTRLFAQVLGD